ALYGDGSFSCSLRADVAPRSKSQDGRRQFTQGVPARKQGDHGSPARRPEETLAYRSAERPRLDQTVAIFKLNAASLELLAVWSWPRRDFCASDRRTCRARFGSRRLSAAAW